MSITSVPTMILRSVVVRHGWKAMCSALRTPSLRYMSSETSRIESSIDNHAKETASVESNINSLSITNDFVTPTDVPAHEDIAANYSTFKHIQKSTGTLGSNLSPYYEPQRLVTQPPAPKDVTLELLMASQVHIGHSTSLWNPGNQRYIFGIRQGVHIISLEVTAAHLRRAAKVVEGVAYHGGLILFVGTRDGQDRCVVKAAKLAKGCHLFQRWIPGSITNGDQLLFRGRIKAVDEMDQEIEGEVFEEKLTDHRSLKPDLVVCLNPIENYVLLHECGLHNIPTIGIVDTDADPTWVTYPIPANDDSLRSVQLIAGVLGRAGESGQKKRIEAAKTGHVTWETPKELREWSADQSKLERNKAVGAVDVARQARKSAPEEDAIYN